MSRENCTVKYDLVVVFNMYVYGITSIVLVGLFVDTLTILVFRRQRPKPNSVHLLELLAYVDILFLLFCLIYFTVRVLVAYARRGSDVFGTGDLGNGPDIMYYITPFYYFGINWRNWLIIVITAERCTSIVLPFWSRVHVTKRKLNMVVLLIGLLSLGIGIVRFWSHRIDVRHDDCSRLDGHYLGRAPFGKEYDLYSYVIVTTVSPLSLMLVMNVYLIYEVIRLTRQSRRLRGTPDARRTATNAQTTLMILAMLLVFFLCEVPVAARRFGIMIGYKLPKEMDQILQKASIVLSIADSAANFFAYAASNRRFRRTVGEILFGRKTASNSANVSHISCSDTDNVPTSMTESVTSD